MAVPGANFGGKHVGSKGLNGIHKSTEHRGRRPKVVVPDIITACM